MHRELSGLIAYAKGQKDQAVTLLKEAVQIEESMRPPNGAADPVKPAHELLGEVLLAGRQAGRSGGSVRHLSGSHAESRTVAARIGDGPRGRRPQGARRRAAGHVGVVLEGKGVHQFRDAGSVSIPDAVITATHR